MNWPIITVAIVGTLGLVVCVLACFWLLTSRGRG